MKIFNYKKYFFFAAYKKYFPLILPFFFVLIKNTYTANFGVLKVFPLKYIYIYIYYKDINNFLK